MTDSLERSPDEWTSEAWGPDDRTSAGRSADRRVPPAVEPSVEPVAQPVGWTRRLAAYRTPDDARSLFELAVTAIPFLAIFALSWAALSVSPWLAAALSLANGAFVIRLFALQHDCGHGPSSPTAAGTTGRGASSAC